ncbi:MAG TPA: TRAP transporter large permease subunit [Verrucomicrobiota bacterium]|nr:TRAP transporter large permease subunit [Verrucomicrobiota bacterium]HNU51918.1 TRAP transporter large permease subunit [Verrucomicrobiota bacterium]
MEISPDTPVAAPRPRWVQWLCGAENLVVVLLLTAMVLLPCTEILLRKLGGRGIAAATPIVQHLVLLVGMLGGALAAREHRLLALSTATTWLRGRPQRIARVFSHGFAAAVTAFLCAASVDFVLASQRLNKILVFGIPVWTVQLVLSVGFGLVAVRLIWGAASSWRGRLGAALLAVGLAVFAWRCPVDPSALRVPGLLVLGVATVLGAPVFATLGGAALILLWSGGETIASIPLNHYRLAVNPTLPSIPLFTLAGYFLAEGGAARRFIALFQAWFGPVRGGPVIVTVLVCAFFTSFTGASGVTILALGGLLLPILLAAGYTGRKSLGLLTSAGSLGLLFPPCLPPILYSIVASSSTQTSVRMEDLFKGGLLPGVLLMSLTVLWGVWRGAGGAEVMRPRWDSKAAWRALRDAKWELLIPVVALVALFGGFATPVEAAAVTALYAFLTQAVIHRDLHIVRDVPRVMTECGLLVGGVLLILGVALGFTHYLIDAEIPDKGVAWVTGAIHSKYVFLLVINLVLLVVGCLMDVYSAIVVVVPLLVPIAQAFGIDMVHLGIIFLANLELGFLTPPVGMNLFLASYRFKKPMGEVTRSVLPMLLVLLVGVLLITYVPWLTTAIPAWWK